MILVAYRHGLRAAEVCSLEWSQVDFALATLHVGSGQDGKPSCRSTRTLICSGMPVAMRWQMPVTIPARYRITSSTRISSTRCGTPSWHRRASRTSGANHSWHFAKGARFPATGESDCRWPTFDSGKVRGASNIGGCSGTARGRRRILSQRRVRQGHPAGNPRRRRRVAPEGPSPAKSWRSGARSSGFVAVQGQMIQDACAGRSRPRVRPATGRRQRQSFPGRTDL
jgi:hypothetical protein